MNTSPRFSFNRQDLIKFLIITFKVGVAAICTYLLQKLGDLQMGEYTPAVTAILTLVIDAVHRWARNNQEGSAK
jgi:hypothetical protein